MSEPNLARVGFTTELSPGQSLTVVKLLSYGWSSTRSMPALRDQVDAALSSARRTGWDGLLAEQREFLDDVWHRVDVEIDGDPALQQAVRFAIFQVVQASARAENRALPAKALTGRGYDGHTFWDQEMYVLPVSAIRSQRRPGTFSNGATRRSLWPGPGRVNCGWQARPFPGARFAARSAPAIGRPGRRRSM